MKKITVMHHFVQHVITIENKKVTVFDTFFEKEVSPRIFDKYIVSRDFTGVINSEQVFLKAARKRTLHNAKYFLSTGMCWLMGDFALEGWAD